MGLLLLLGLVFLIFGLGGILGLLTFAGYAAIILIVLGLLGALIGGLASAVGGAREESVSQRTRREMEEEHHHECYKGHHWQHTGPTVLKCSLSTYDTISLLDCPTCTGREELMIRGPHSHHCTSCRGDWTHQGRCTDGQFKNCPWCSPEPEATPISGMKRGTHDHYCPQCFQKWQHDPPALPLLYPFISKPQESCTAPHLAPLPECPGCREVARPENGTVASRVGRALGNAVKRVRQR